MFGDLVTMFKELILHILTMNNAHILEHQYGFKNTNIYCISHRKAFIIVSKIEAYVKIFPYFFLNFLVNCAFFVPHYWLGT